MSGLVRLQRPDDLGPASQFMRQVPFHSVTAGRCPSCGGFHIFVWVKGNHPDPEQLGRDVFLVEPFPEDRAVPPRR